MGVLSRCTTARSVLLRGLSLALCALVVAAGTPVVARYAAVGFASAPDAPVVHAEQSGLRLGTRALTGRVTLVVATAGVRWRILGVTGWRQARGRVLVKAWDTTAVSDGPHVLELATGRVTTSRALFVRNHTYLRPSLEANASRGLDRRSTDTRAVVAAFAHRSYQPGETAVLNFWARYPQVRVELLHVGPEQRLTVGNETMRGVLVAVVITLNIGDPQHTTPVGYSSTRAATGTSGASSTSGTPSGLRRRTLSRPARTGGYGSHLEASSARRPTSAPGRRVDWTSSPAAPTTRSGTGGSTAGAGRAGNRSAASLRPTRPRLRGVAAVSTSSPGARTARSGTSGTTAAGLAGNRSAAC